MHGTERSTILAAWHERVEIDLLLLVETVKTDTGQGFTPEAEKVVRHQLERMVIDIVQLTRQEEKLEGKE